MRHHLTAEHMPIATWIGSSTVRGSWTAGVVVVMYRDGLMWRFLPGEAVGQQLPWRMTLADAHERMTGLNFRRVVEC